MFTPIIAGLLIDRTRMAWLWLFLFGLVAFISVLLPLLAPVNSHALYFTYLQINILGESCALICKYVILSKWFRGQFSLPIVFAGFSTLMTPIIQTVVDKQWEKFVVPQDQWTEKGYKFDFQALSKVELHVGIASFVAIILVCLIEFIANRGKRISMQRKMTANGKLNGSVISSD
jgi:MFS family permease